jgi:DNA-binding NarL/FixJ family response regulator
MARAGAGDAEGMRHHLEGAVAMATEGGPASARCEALARLAIEAAGLIARGSSDGVAAAQGGAPDRVLMELVERSVAQVRELLPLLPGHAPWGAQADAALATVALGRGDVGAAVTSGGAALQALQAGLHEDVSLEIVIPAARAVFAGAPPEVQGSVRHSSSPLSRSHGTADNRCVRGSPPHQARARRAGRPMDAAVPSGAPSQVRRERDGPDDTERRLLQHLTEGRTNAEIAAELGLDEGDVGQHLTRLFARLGTSSRAEATSLAFRGLAAVGSR